MVAQGVGMVSAGDIGFRVMRGREPEEGERHWESERGSRGFQGGCVALGAVSSSGK